VATEAGAVSMAAASITVEASEEPGLALDWVSVWPGPMAPMATAHLTPTVATTITVDVISSVTAFGRLTDGVCAEFKCAVDLQKNTPAGLCPVGF
jgi:hypothetical protein